MSALITLPSGMSLHYVVQGRTDGEPIVLIHGIGDSWHSYELVLPLIPDRYRVYALSLRGHGLSDAPDTGYLQKDFADDVTAFMEAMNLRGVTLVGHSLGSFAAQIVAANDAGRLKRLVLIGSGPGGAPAVAKEAREEFEAISRDPRRARDFQASTLHKPVPADFFERMVASAASVPARLWAQFGPDVHNADTAAGLASIKVPTLLVWGDRDSMLSRKDQDTLLARIKGSRLIVYPETGHTPHWEDPQRFAADLLEFMR
jgi:pimeloyl-ACP methyl ester carboxylesterase